MNVIAVTLLSVWCLIWISGAVSIMWNERRKPGFWIVAFCVLITCAMMCGFGWHAYTIFA